MKLQRQLVDTLRLNRKVQGVGHAQFMRAAHPPFLSWSGHLAATLTSLGNQGVNVNQAESYLSQFQTSVAASSAATAGLSSNLMGRSG